MKDNWFTSMLSGDPADDDLIKSSPLNITKITALFVPLVTAAAAVLDAKIFKEDGVLAGLTAGQKLTLVISLIVFVGVIVVADMLTRAKVTAAALSAPISALPEGIAGKWILPGKDAACSVVAARAGGGSGGGGGQLLIVAEIDAKTLVNWVDSEKVRFD